MGDNKDTWKMECEGEDDYVYGFNVRRVGPPPPPPAGWDVLRIMGGIATLGTSEVGLAIAMAARDAKAIYGIAIWCRSEVDANNWEANDHFKFSPLTPSKATHSVTNHKNKYSDVAQQPMRFESPLQRLGLINYPAEVDNQYTDNVPKFCSKAYQRISKIEVGIEPHFGYTVPFGDDTAVNGLKIWCGPPL